MGRDECSTSLYFNHFQGWSFYKANKVSLQTGKIQFSFCCLNQMSLILAKSVKTLEEDNNTSKKHSTGERKEGGEQPSKGLQNKVKKKEPRQSPLDVILVGQWEMEEKLSSFSTDVTP